MGAGDVLMAIGDARKAWLAKGKRRKIAIGDGKTVEKSNLLVGLPYLATQFEADHPGYPTDWLISANSMRPYVDYAAMRAKLPDTHRDVKQRHIVRLIGHYIWKKDYRVSPGEIAFSRHEERVGEYAFGGKPFIAIEPHIKPRSPVSRDYGFQRWQQVVDILVAEGFRVLQVSVPTLPLLNGAEMAKTNSFREAAAVIANARVMVASHGGFDHAAAAVGTRMVSVFGSFADPAIIGYDWHVNLIGSAKSFCGTKGDCPHCRMTLKSISPQLIAQHVRSQFHMPRLDPPHPPA